MENDGLILVQIDETNAGTRIDKALASHPQIRTRSRAEKLIENGRVRLKGQSVKASHITRVGDTIEVYILPPQDKTSLKPLARDLNIVFEDADLIVIDKPAGLVVHPAPGHANDTLVNALVHHTRDLSMGFGEARPGIVHRLDRDTSGLLVVAKNDAAHEGLARQFKEKTSHRVYWAIVFGKPKPAAGTCTSFLARHPKDRKRFASLKDNRESPHARRAVTHYRILRESMSGVSWMELQLETGRTHQIRVHLSELGHPIVGDHVYGSVNREKTLSSVELRKAVGQMKRFALHATELGFMHPRTGEELKFSSDWPKDITPLLEKIKWV